MSDGSEARETAYNFGAQGNLVGIATTPAADASRTDLPAVLLLNAGLVHRVGPYRLYTDLARRLAGQRIGVRVIDNQPH